MERDFSFARRAPKYDEGFEGKASRRFYRLLLKEVALEPGCRLLDAGCGTGALLGKLSESCEIKAFGIDAEEAMVAQAQAKHPGMDIRLSRSGHTPFEDSSFDIVIACMAYHHFSDRDAFALEAARLLRPGGMLYIADPRLPFPVRKILNGLLRLMRVTGEFFSVDEMASRFSGYGFSPAGSAADGYAQVVKLRKDRP